MVTWHMQVLSMQATVSTSMMRGCRVAARTVRVCLMITDGHVMIMLKC